MGFYTVDGCGCCTPECGDCPDGLPDTLKLNLGSFMTFVRDGSCQPNAALGGRDYSWISGPDPSTACLVFGVAPPGQCDTTIGPCSYWCDIVVSIQLYAGAEPICGTIPESHCNKISYRAALTSTGITVEICFTVTSDLDGSNGSFAVTLSIANGTGNCMDEFNGAINDLINNPITAAHGGTLTVTPDGC